MLHSMKWNFLARGILVKRARQNNYIILANKYTKLFVFRSHFLFHKGIANLPIILSHKIKAFVEKFELNKHLQSAFLPSLVQSECNVMHHAITSKT